MKRVVSTAALLAAVTLAPACGDNQSPATPDAGVDVDADPTIDEDGCRILTLDERQFQLNLFGQITGLRYPVAPNLGGEPTDFLLLELYDSTTPDLPPLTTGTFDLATAPNDDLATCQHCLWVKVDENDDGTADAFYYQAEGTLTLDYVEDPLGPVFAGSTSRVVLRRATISDDGHSTFEAGGDCVSVTGVEFDTRPTPGADCFSAEDCGNPLLEVCDPDRNRCVEPQCGDFLSCPEAGQMCVSQYADSFDGACYRVCDPTAAETPCSTLQRCVQFGPDPTFGVCTHVGDGATGDACEVEDTSTSCAGNGVCSRESETCTPSCLFFAAETGCPAGTACSALGVCEALSSGYDLAFGEECPADAELAAGCAPDGESFRGICFAYEPDPMHCEKACLGDQGCTTGEFCAPRFDPWGFGICLPLPVCGDGVRGEINETCDDGNTSSGDGCSGDCQTVEYGVICGGAPTLPFGADVAGDTLTAYDGFMSSCQPGLARADVYEVALPGPGRLHLSVQSTTVHTLSLRGTCADAGTETHCVDNSFEGEITLQITDAAPAPLTAMVSAQTVLEEGPYTVRADFVPESCGDGIIAGNEVCDDGNTASADGCSGDCRTVEYDVHCAQAPVLSTTQVNTGDTTGGPRLYDTTCFNDDGGSGPDHLYTFVAPSDGTLHVTLTDFDNFLVLAVLDGCSAPPVTELACRPAFLGAALDVPLVAGQDVTVLVDGYLIDSEGTYEVTASFTTP